MPERRPAVLFDVDGTLVDSNYLHVHAWHQTFHEMDLIVESWRVHRGIGMDGAALVGSLVGDEHLDRAKELHARHYGLLSDLLLPLNGARELLDAVAARDLQVVLASSAPEGELDLLRRTLDRDEILSVTTDSGDVETAKPNPDIVRVALERAGVDATDAVFVGDSVWDVRAAVRSGVTCIALRSGGTSEAELKADGATAIWDDPRDLLDHLDDSPIGALTRRASCDRLS